MWKKVVGSIALISLTAGLLWSQVNPVATLTIHGYQTSTAADSLPGITLSGANAPIQDVRVWVDQDSCDFSLPATLAATWAITEEYTTQGKTYCHARTLVPTDAIRSGQILNLVYTGTDSVQMVQSGTFQTHALFYSDPDQKFVNATTTIAGAALSEIVPVITFTLHSSNSHGGAGVDLVSNVSLRQLQFNFDREIGTFRIAIGDSLQKTWEITQHASNLSAYTTVRLETTDDDSLIMRGHILDLRYSGPDTLRFLAEPNIFEIPTGGSYRAESGVWVWQTATTSGQTLADVDSFATQGLRQAVMHNYDKSHSGAYPSVFPDSITTEWSAPGFWEGAPVFHIGNYVISVKGNEQDYDSTAVVCRNDTTGALIWSHIVQDTMMVNLGYSWPLGAWMGADSLVYVTRKGYGMWQIGRVSALNLSDGSVAWVAANDSLCSSPTEIQDGSLIMEDGDFVGLASITGSGTAWVTRYSGTDGSIVWNRATCDISPGFCFSAVDAVNTLFAYNNNGVENIVFVNPYGDVYTMRASDGLLLNRAVVPQFWLGAPNLIVSDAALCDSATSPGVAMYHTGDTVLRSGWPSLTGRTWRDGVMSGNQFQMYTWYTTAQMPLDPYDNSMYAWLLPNDNTVGSGPHLLVAPIYNNGVKLYTLNVPGTGESHGFTRNTYIRDLPDMGLNLYTIASDVDRQVIVWMRSGVSVLGNISLFTGAARYDDGVEGEATRLWGFNTPHCSFATAIGAAKNRVWLNYDGRIVCLKKAAIGSTHASPPPPRGDEEIEP